MHTLDENRTSWTVVIITTGLALMLAYILKWTVGDLLWSFWFASITVAITSLFFFFLALGVRTKGPVVSRIFGVIMSSIIIGGFFLFWFGAFFYMLAGLINGLFPLEHNLFISEHAKLPETCKIFFNFYIFMFHRYALFLPFVFWEARSAYSFKKIPSFDPRLPQHKYTGNTLLAKFWAGVVIIMMKLMFVIFVTVVLLVMNFNAFIIYPIAYFVLFTQWLDTALVKKLKQGLTALHR